MTAETTTTTTPRASVDAIKQALSNAQTALRLGQMVTCARQLDVVDAALREMARERGI